MIEDSPTQKELMIRNLELAYKKDELNIQTAGTLADGKNLAEVCQFDIILLDLNLPDSDPDNTLEKFEPITATVPVIVITANESFGEKALSFGIQHYMEKCDVDSNSLRVQIKYAILRLEYMQKLQEEEQMQHFISGMKESVGLLEKKIERLQEARSIQKEEIDADEQRNRSANGTPNKLAPRVDRESRDDDG